MQQKMLAHSRGPQILALLAEYGPLSTKGLETIIRPKISRRRLQEALFRLYEKGLVIKRFEASPFSRQYYELSQTDKVRDEVHKLTGISQDRLIQPYFRSQELLHNEECAFWTFYLKQLFEDAEVIRDFQFSFHKELVQQLMLDRHDANIKPDILLHFYETAETEKFTIAFEVELSRKSDKRLFQKLSTFSNETRIDGVVYLCHRNNLIDTILSIYKSKKQLAKSLRIDHYADLFLLLGDRTFVAESGEPKLLNFNNESVKLTDWVHFFKNHSRLNRAVHHRKVQLVSAGHRAF